MKSNLFRFFCEDQKRQDDTRTHEWISEQLEVPRPMVSQWAISHRRIGGAYWHVFDNPLIVNHKFKDTPELREFCEQHGLPTPRSLKLTLQNYLKSSAPSVRTDKPHRRPSERPAKKRKAAHIS